MVVKLVLFRFENCQPDHRAFSYSIFTLKKFLLNFPYFKEVRSLHFRGKISHCPFSLSMIPSSSDVPQCCTLCKYTHLFSQSLCTLQIVMNLLLEYRMKVTLHIKLLGNTYIFNCIYFDIFGHFNNLQMSFIFVSLIVEQNVHLILLILLLYFCGYIPGIQALF